MNETTPRFKMVNGQIKTWQVARFVPTNKLPDYEAPKARKIIQAELGDMKREITSAYRTKSTLVFNDDGSAHRSAGDSTFPKYMREAGISSTSDFIKVMNSKKGIRFKRLEKAAISRLENGIDEKFMRAEPDEDFLKASGQIYDRKDVIFRRVRGRLIPMRVPKDKRLDLMQEAPF